MRTHFLSAATHPVTLVVVVALLQVSAIGGAGWIGWYSHEKLGPRPEPIILHVKDPAPVHIDARSSLSCVERGRAAYQQCRMTGTRRGD